MASITEIFGNPLITLIIALVSAIIPIILYYREKINSKEKILNCHLIKLHDLTAKILEDKAATELLSTYQDLRKEGAKYNENSHASTESKNALEQFEPVLCSYLNFLHCQNASMSLTVKSKEFHLEFQKMDSKGYLSLLKKRHKETYLQLIQFDNYVNSILFILRQNDKIELLNIENTSLDQYLDEKQPEHIRLLIQILPLLRNLLLYAPTLEKQLNKLL